MPDKPLRLFVNYRRADFPDFVSHIRTHFMNRYGRENVFMDFDSIPRFAQFEDFIRQQVRGMDALVMIIGPKWLKLMETKRKNGDPDYVLVELEEALKHGVFIAPILIKGAAVPPDKALPESLRPIFKTNVTELRHDRDVLNTIDAIMNDLAAQVIGSGKRVVAETRPKPAPKSAKLNIEDALDQFAEAQEKGDLPAALLLLDRIQFSGATIPAWFGLDGLRAEIEDAIQAQEEEQRRLEVAQYLYSFIPRMIRLKRPAAQITAAFAELWSVYPDYDPDGLTGKGQKPPNGSGKSLPDLARRVLAVLPGPFEWCAAVRGTSIITSLVPLFVRGSIPIFVSPLSDFAFLSLFLPFLSDC